MRRDMDGESWTIRQQGNKDGWDALMKYKIIQYTPRNHVRAAYSAHVKFM